ncbi:MAG TPA: SIMPL domain-containing protein [Xanthobacteraceae bacterium]|nr:SIMPL domain-containing protein [Xanthobacteraceae bacterium]
MTLIRSASPCVHLRGRRLLRRAAVAVAVLFSLSGEVLAQTPQPAPEAGIVVTGEGSVLVVPNTAQIRIGVTVRNDTVTAALDTDSRAMAAVIAALKAAGIAETDIQTTRFSIQPIYTQPPSFNSPGAGAAPKLAGYSVSNHVNVTIRDADKIGILIDRAVAAGANDIGNVLFAVSDTSKVLDPARADAIADARRRAEVYAKAAGVRLGTVQWVTEETASRPPLPMMSRAVAAPVPIATGEDTLRVRVTVGFDIAR